MYNIIRISTHSFLRVYAFGEIGLRRYGNVYTFTSHLQILSANCLHQNICYNEKWFEASEINITQHYIQLEDNLHQVCGLLQTQIAPNIKVVGMGRIVGSQNNLNMSLIEVISCHQNQIILGSIILTPFVINHCGNCKSCLTKVT